MMVRLNVLNIGLMKKLLKNVKNIVTKVLKVKVLYLFNIYIIYNNSNNKTTILIFLNNLIGTRYKITDDSLFVYQNFLIEKLKQIKQIKQI